MRFAYTEDQQAFRDATRDMLANECTPAAIRSAWDGAPDPKPWTSLEAMGVLSVLVPEAEGGLGLDEVFLTPIIQECGYAGLAHPVVETAMVAAPLGAFPAGQAVATDLGGPVVAAADVAGAFLLSGDGSLRSFQPDEVAIEHVSTVDRARHGARVTALGDGGLISDDPRVMAAAVDRGVLGTAAFQVGLAYRMLDMTVEYVQERQQFGKPIGSQQALKHHLANVRLALEFATPALAGAALALSQGSADASRDVSMAKVLATRASETATRSCLQCHGAIGYTVEHDLQLFMKRAWALARSWGDANHHLDAVSATLWP